MGITILGDLFSASQPMAFNELLQYLNGCQLTPSGSGMTALDYVRVILRGAEDARYEIAEPFYMTLRFSQKFSDDIVTDALASVSEASTELLAPAKHAQDLYASLINGESGNLGSRKLRPNFLNKDLSIVSIHSTYKKSADVAPGMFYCIFFLLAQAYDLLEAISRQYRRRTTAMG